MCTAVQVTYDEQPGCKIFICSMGSTEESPESGGVVASTVYYGVNSGPSTVVKWANDQGYVGVVQELSDEVQTLLYYKEKEQLVITTSGCTMLVLAKDETNPGNWQTISKMKFATGTGETASQLQVGG